VNRRIGAWALIVPKIDAWESTLQKETETDLRRRSLSLRYRAKCQEPLGKLLPEAFALVREASRRVLNKRHFEVQMLGGIALHEQSVVEMQTGEGKTLTATLPLYLNSLTGRGVHLATANDYLARRDKEEMEPIYKLLGLSVGVIQGQMSQDDRRAAYRCDITYGTAKEFGFDFLRDQLLLRGIREGSDDVLARMLGHRTNRHEDPVQRDAHYLVVDEADSLLIDDARTPLIISALPGAPPAAKVAAFQWAAEVVSQFRTPEEYDWDHQRRSAELTLDGRKLARNLPKPELMDAIDMQSIYDYIERAILAKREFKRDQQYIVTDDEIVIIDESTGRPAEGRKWRDGLHQAVEAQEKVEITLDTGQAARITVQDFAIRYERLAGMTGTALSAGKEFLKVYNLRVVPVPTNRPPIRKRLQERIYTTSQARWEAIVKDIQEIIDAGRSVLIGTRSIDKSEHLSRMLQKAGIPHKVLNAHRVAEEAEIVAAAGEPGKVTVSTNMAGRGTDIKLHPAVKERGGLHVIVSEMHESARIDRQLIGRCGRQGDPGTYRFYLSLEDDLLKIAYGPDKTDRWKAQYQHHTRRLDHWMPLFQRAQLRVETQHFQQRKQLLYHERERKKAQIQMGQDPYLDNPL